MIEQWGIYFYAIMNLLNFIGKRSLLNHFPKPVTRLSEIILQKLICSDRTENYVVWPQATTRVQRLIQKLSEGSTKKYKATQFIQWVTTTPIRVFATLPQETWSICRWNFLPFGGTEALKRQLRIFISFIQTCHDDPSHLQVHRRTKRQKGPHYS